MKLGDAPALLRAQGAAKAGAGENSDLGVPLRGAGPTLTVRCSSLPVAEYTCGCRSSYRGSGIWFSKTGVSLRMQGRPSMSPANNCVKLVRSIPAEAGPTGLSRDLDVLRHGAPLRMQGRLGRGEQAFDIVWRIPAGAGPIGKWACRSASGKEHSCGGRSDVRSILYRRRVMRRTD